MPLDVDTAQRLIEQLAHDRQAFIENTNKTNELLQEKLVSLRALSNQQYNTTQTPPTMPSFQPLPLLPLPNHSRNNFAAYEMNVTQASQRTTTADIEVESVPSDQQSSTLGESDSESDDESIFVQRALEPESYDMEGFRDHLQNHSWTKGGRAILRGLDENSSELKRPCIFPVDRYEAEADRSHLSHYSIYDVGFDGVPLNIVHAGSGPPTRALQIWDRIKSTNANPKHRPAAGRIVIVREPSPKLFAALHYTMNKHFDVDEMFDLLEHEDPRLMFPHRAFDRDDRHRRSFVITMEYYTIIGEQCKPMKWQHSDEDDERQRISNHIPISRCSSVIALSLEGPPMTKVRNRDRRIHNKYGEVYDPFSPWRVLSIQAYPDWHATTDTHKPSMHYVNGPEAFLHTVEAEFEDARKRLKEVYNRVSELVEPPPNFIFNSKVREALLFEDDKFTYSKRYFWAYQTLSIINSDITEMIESYRDTFRECVWEGSNKIIWPGEASTSSRFQHFRKRMAKLKLMMDDEIEKLEYIKTMNSKKMQDIEALRDNLFSGTSVMESRRSVEQTLVTIEQNRSVLLLTLVTIFFLPLTFVTSVFGMTNMDPSESDTHFAWTVIAVCIPTYLFIGSMHTDSGLHFWSHNKSVLFSTMGEWLARSLALVGYVPAWARGYAYDARPAGLEEDDLLAKRSRRGRSNSATRLAMSMRMRQASATAAAATGHYAAQSPSLSPILRFNSRDRHDSVEPPDRYIPRPQPTSGDVRNYTEMDTPGLSRSRGTEVKFSIDTTAQVHNLAVQEADAESVSPRTGSPGRTNTGGWDATEARDGVGSRARGFFGRWRRKKDGVGRDVIPGGVGRPCV